VPAAPEALSAGHDDVLCPAWWMGVGRPASASACLMPSLETAPSCAKARALLACAVRVSFADGLREGA
jgi:hypothetical protein